MSESHGASDVHGHDASNGGPAKGSPRRLIIVTFIMLSIAALSFLPSLFSRGGTNVTSAGYSFTSIFIPVWLTLTVGVVIIAFWFFRALITLERNRDGETPRPAEPVHSH